MTIVQLTSTDPYYNLALEEYLFENSDRDYLLLYTNSPCVVLGYNQSVQNEVNTEFCRRSNIALVRRSSGGGAVYHDYGNLNFSFIRNTRKDMVLLSDDFLYPVVDWFRGLDIALEIGKRKDLWLKSGKKVCGTASRVSKGRLLQHGTLLINANSEHLRLSLQPGNTDNTIKATKSVRSETANIFPEYKNEKITPDEFRDLLFAQVLKYYNLSSFSAYRADDTKVSEIRQKLMDNRFVFRK